MDKKHKLVDDDDAQNDDDGAVYENLSILNRVVKKSHQDTQAVVKQQAVLVIQSTSDKIEKIDDRIEEVVDSQNGVVNAFNQMSSGFDNMRGDISVLTDRDERAKKADKRAEASEHTSRVVRGLLGAQERRRRKVDLDEISRLRNEVGVCRRQIRDKDRIIVEMKAELAALRDEIRSEFDDMKKFFIEQISFYQRR
jgi:hypothetical protein